MSCREEVRQWLRKSWAKDKHGPCSHCQFYPTRVPFANCTCPVARVHTASAASGSSGTLRPHRECSQWTRIQFALGRRCSECASGRVLFASDEPPAHVSRLTYFFPLLCQRGPSPLHSTNATYATRSRDWPNDSIQAISTFASMFPRISRDQHMILLTHGPKKVIYMPRDKYM